MEQLHTWQNCFSLDHLEIMDLNFDEDEFFSDIFLPPHGLCSQTESDHNSSTVTTVGSVDNTASAAAADVCNTSFDNNGLIDSSSSSSFLNSYMDNSKQPVSSCTLSFDKSDVLPITNEPPCPQLDCAHTSSPLSTSKRTRRNRNVEARNRTRSSSETIHHIMTERKRRQDLTQKFIALSATIPGLKKIDKASVLREAINYVKQLQERVRELENEEKSKRASSIERSMKNEEKQYSEVCCNCRSFEALPEMEARVLGKHILIRIHCERQNDMMLKMMALLESIHLSVLSCSSLPFGNSAYSITIVALMGEKYNLRLNDLLKYLRQDQLLKPLDVQ